jgi:hypothetical protein
MVWYPRWIAQEIVAARMTAPMLGWLALSLALLDEFVGENGMQHGNSSGNHAWKVEEHPELHL